MSPQGSDFQESDVFKVIRPDRMFGFHRFHEARSETASAKKKIPIPLTTQNAPAFVPNIHKNIVPAIERAERERIPGGASLKHLLCHQYRFFELLARKPRRDTVMVFRSGWGGGKWNDTHGTVLANDGGGQVHGRNAALESRFGDVEEGSDVGRGPSLH